MLFSIINLIFSVINILILIRVLLSWLAPMSRNGFTDLIYQLTEPILRPFRVLIPLSSFRVDISPIIAYIFFNIVRRVIFMLIY